ncbi:hypothetical protein [Mesorhizobium sp. WSM1497]|uniref:hypothetical protein n=1 Tax=Mesorhizobium sp. WSM1497 TaxID=278153 RepID=UPI0012F9635E
METAIRQRGSKRSRYTIVRIIGDLDNGPVLILPDAFPVHGRPLRFDDMRRLPQREKVGIGSEGAGNSRPTVRPISA